MTVVGNGSQALIVRVWPRRVVRKACLKCGDSWTVPAAVAGSRQRWRRGGYSMVDAHSAGSRVMSKAYMSYLGEDKHRRDSQRDADLRLGVSLDRCPTCQSEAHVESHRRPTRSALD